MAAVSKVTLSLGAIKEMDPKLQYKNRVFMNPSDMAKLAVKDGDHVCVEEVLVHKVSGDSRVPEGQLMTTSLNWQALHLDVKTAVGKMVKVEDWNQAKHNRGHIAHGISIVVDLFGKTKTEIQAEHLEKYVRRVFNSEIFCKDQRWIITTKIAGIDRWFSLRVASVHIPVQGERKEDDSSSSSSKKSKSRMKECQCAMLSEEGTIVTLLQASNPLLKLVHPVGSGIKAFGPSWDPESMGIGGLDSQFGTIFRRAFASRMFPPQIVRELGMKHVKGMLLYGPPGTGKTLIARSIGKLLTEREPKVVNGPEILNKYVGASEENIRVLFQDARDDQDANGDKAGLHIIIFDEIDAICKSRGSGGGGAGSGVHDTVVNQLLSMIDGVNALNNILVIGMTNRKDLIDEALLRSGRLEVHIEIGLPDERGREQIFRIHTRSLREHGRLDDEISLAEYARRTKNYTGAEIEGVIRSAISFAMQELIDVENLQMLPPEKLRSIKITKDFFELALEEVKCEFGNDDDELMHKYNADSIISFNPEVDALITEVKRIVTSLRKSAELSAAAAASSASGVGAAGAGGTAGSFQMNAPALMIKGGIGCGKTALASYLALQSEFPFVRVLTMDDFVGASDWTICQKIGKMFDDAYKSNLSVIIIDDFERLIGYTVGLRFRETIFNTLITCIRRSPTDTTRKILVITTCDSEVCASLKLDKYFDWIRSMPLVKSRSDLRNVIQASGHDLYCSADDLESVIQEFPDPAELPRWRGIGIANLLKVLEFSVDETGKITPDSFRAALHSKIQLFDDSLIMSTTLS